MLEKRDQNFSGNDSRDRSVQLFSFLREFLQLQLSEIRSIDAYTNHLWLHSIPQGQDSSCLFNSGDTPDSAEDWIVVKKPVFEDPPLPPDKLSEWLTPEHHTDSRREYPELMPELNNGNTDIQTKLTDVRSSIQPLWETYVEKEWWPWAKADRQKRTVDTIFRNLFQMYQRQSSLDGLYEIVIGFGFLYWNSGIGQLVKHHAISARTTVEYDDATETIRIKAAAGGLRLSLEPVLENHPVQWDLSDVREQLKLIEDISSADALDACLTKLAVILSGNGEFSPESTPAKEPQSSPIVHRAPALILRRRLPSQATLHLIGQIQADLQNNQELPGGLENLLNGLEGVADSAAAASSSKDAHQQIIHYPLEANIEQFKAARDLDRSREMVLNAPPGTGSTQTIANLLCHLLSQGKRVLVTSSVTAHLEELLARLPEEYSCLRAPLLRDDLNTLHDLEEIIQDFVDQHDGWSSEENGDELKNLQSGYTDLLSEKEQITATLESSFETIKIHGTLDSGAYEGTPEEIIKRLREESEYYDWFPDVPAEDAEPPLTNTEAVEFVLLLRQISPEKEVMLNKRLIDPIQLMKTDDFTKYKEIEDMARDKNDEFFNNRENTNHPILSKTPTEMRDELLDALSRIMDTYQLLNQHVYNWIKTAAKDILNGGVDGWRSLAQETSMQLDYIRTRIPAVADIRVSGLGAHSMHESKLHAIQLYEFLQSGGKIGSGPFRPKLLKDTAYITRDVLIDGIPVTDEEQLQPLIVYLDIADRLETLTDMWESFTELPKKAPIQIQFVEFENLFKTLLRALELDSFVYVFRTVAVQIDGFEEPDWSDFDSLDNLRTSLLAINLEENAQRPFKLLGRILWNLRPDSEAHPIIKSLLTAVKNRDHLAYERRMRKLERAWQLQQQLQRRTAILDKMSEYCPKLLQSILVSYESPEWDSRVSRFTGAWEWARLNAMYKASNPSVDKGNLEVQLERVQRELADTLTRLGSERAKYHCFSGLSAATQQSLREWSAASRFMAKQTNNVGHLHRKVYRENIQLTTTAIPAWILPLYRIPEVFQAERNLFDFAIVDQANLTGPEGLLLTFLARKLIVTGDEKQVSSTNLQLLEEGLGNQLREVHLKDFPNAELIGEEQSLYDLMSSIAEKPLQLREHFRCHSEIIDFSNQLAYPDKPMIPLRQPDAFSLLPALMSERITDPALQIEDFGIINLSEIDAITARLKECLEDEAYMGKTFAILTLDSKAQAAELEKRLMEDIGTELFTERRLICSTVEECSSLERDVLFISMVSGSGQLQPPLGDLNNQRIFNTMLTCGREQIWVFHSMGMEDLDPADLRYKLLSYLQKPGQHFSDNSSAYMGELITKASISLQTRSSLPAPFVSWLQIEIFHLLAERDYSVIPCTFIGDYFADLVIESPNGSLVLECLSNDQASKDTRKLNLGKMRRLERLGWSFWQIEETAFAEKGPSALEPLWQLLQALNISPLDQSKLDDDSEASISITTDIGFNAADYLNGNDMNGSGDNNYSLDEDSSADLIQFSAEDLQNAIMRSLSQSPKHSCPKDELAARVCLLLDIHPEDKVMRSLEKHVSNVLLHMEEERIISGASGDGIYVYLLDASSESSQDHFNSNGTPPSP